MKRLRRIPRKSMIPSNMPPRSQSSQSNDTSRLEEKSLTSELTSSSQTKPAGTHPKRGTTDASPNCMLRHMNAPPDDIPEGDKDGGSTVGIGLCFFPNLTSRRATSSAGSTTTRSWPLNEPSMMATRSEECSRRRCRLIANLELNVK